MDDGRPPGTRRGWQPVVGKFLAAVLALGVGTCSFALDVHKIAWYAVFPHSYYMEIKTDLTVDGEAVQLSGVAECKWVQRLTPMFTHVAGSGWDRWGGVLAKRLPSGEAVIALVQPPCRARDKHTRLRGAKKGFWKTVRPLDAPAGHLPIQTLLLDDAEEPTRIERSFSKAHFADPRAHVRYLGGTWKPIKRGARTDPREEVPWLRVRGAPSKIWGGFLARVTSREVWSKETAVAAVLEPLTKVTQLTPELRLPSYGFDLSDGNVRTLYLRNGYWDYRPDVPDPDGLVVLYERKDPVSKETIRVYRLDTTIFGAQSRLSVKGQPTGVTHPIYSWAWYEPESKTILFIRGDVVSVSANEVRFDRVSNTLSGSLFKF